MGFLSFLFPPPMASAVFLPFSSGGSHWVAQNGLPFTILLPWLLELWDYRPD